MTLESVFLVSLVLRNDFKFVVSIQQGGIGDAVLDAVAETRNILVRKMCVREVPRSGPPMVLLEKFGIGTECIVKEVQEFSKVA